MTRGAITSLFAPGALAPPRPSKRLSAHLVVPLLAVSCAIAAPSRSETPEPPAMPSPASRIPAVHRSETRGGTTVLVARRDHAPLVSVRLVSRGGHATDPPEKAGLAALAYGLFTEHLAATGDPTLPFGASDRPDLMVEADGASIGATVLPADVEPALFRLARALETFSVDEDALLRMAREGPPVAARALGRVRIAEAAVARRMLGEHDALAVAVQGTPSSRLKTSAEDIERFVQRHLSLDSIAIVLAGPVEPGRILETVDGLFGAPLTRTQDAPDDRSAALNAGASMDEQTGEPAFGSTLSRVLGRGEGEPTIRVTAGGSPRLVVAVGAPSPADCPDSEAAFRMAEQALGGVLRWQLREKERISYRVAHQLSLHRAGGLLTAFAFMEPRDMSAAERAARRAIADAARWASPKGSLAAIRAGALHTLLDEMDTVCDLASATGRLFKRGLEADHYRKVAEALEGARARQTAGLVERMLDPAACRVFVFGPD